MKRIALASLLMAVLCASVVTAGARPAGACSCIGFTDAQALAAADAAFVGTVTKVDRPQHPSSSIDPVTWTFDVEGVFKGDVAAHQEIVRLLLAEGALERSDDAIPGRFPVPQGVRAAIRRRLAPLPPGCCDVLTVASVVGRDFDPVLLQRACRVDGEALLVSRDDVAVSSGAACTQAEPSHVLLALGLSKDAALASLRFGVGRSTTAAEIDAAADRVVGVVKRLRQMAPA